MFRTLLFILILFIDSNRGNLFAQQINYLNASSEEIEAMLDDDSKLKEICKTEGLHILNVDDFYLYDMSKEYFFVSVYAPCLAGEKFIDEIKKTNTSLHLIMGRTVPYGKDNEVIYPDFQDVRMEISKDSIQKDPKNSKYVTFLAKHPFRVVTSVFPPSTEKEKPSSDANAEMIKKPGHFYYPINFKDQSEAVAVKLNAKFPFYMPDRLTHTNEQPELIEMTPNGGIPGSSVTVIGKNFGDDLDKIDIEISSDSNPDIIYSYYINPFYLGETDDGKKRQIIKFSLPVLSQSSFLHTVFKVRILVKSRPSDYKNISIVPVSWKWQTILLSNILLIALLTLVALIMQRPNFINAIYKDKAKVTSANRSVFSSFMHSILIDKGSETYSLSKFQAFAWTFVIIGCYFNLAVSHGLLLRDGLIPKFNESLIVLMSISFGGLISSGAIGIQRKKNEKLTTPPAFSDFFSQGGTIDLPRLQLFLFTLSSILIYLYTVYTFDSMESLPDVPQSLLALMGVSQGGYIGGKFMGGKVTISLISPNEVKIGEIRTITILGSGFEPESKILFEGFDVLKAEFLNQNSLTCSLPAFTEEGEKRLILIPPTGHISHLDNAIYVKGALEEQDLPEEITEKENLKKETVEKENLKKETVEKENLQKNRIKKGNKKR